jgi:hypothetical protein
MNLFNGSIDQWVLRVVAIIAAVKGLGGIFLGPQWTNARNGQVLFEGRYQGVVVGVIWIVVAIAC